MSGLPRRSRRASSPSVARDALVYASEHEGRTARGLLRGASPFAARPWTRDSRSWMASPPLERRSGGDGAVGEVLGLDRLRERERLGAAQSGALRDQVAVLHDPPLHVVVAVPDARPDRPRL